MVTWNQAKLRKRGCVKASIKLDLISGSVPSMAKLTSFVKIGTVTSLGLLSFHFRWRNVKFTDNLCQHGYQSCNQPRARKPTHTCRTNLQSTCYSEAILVPAVWGRAPCLWCSVSGNWTRTTWWLRPLRPAVYRKQRNYKVFLLYRNNQLRLLPTNSIWRETEIKENGLVLVAHLCFALFPVLFHAHIFPRESIHPSLSPLIPYSSNPSIHPSIQSFNQFISFVYSFIILSVIQSPFILSSIL